MNSLFSSLPSSRRWWILLGLGFFIVFLLRQVPASWGGYALTRGTGLALSGLTGTLWEGRASLASIKLENVEHSLGQMHWELSPWSLLLFKTCVQLDTKLGDVQSFNGQVCSGAGGNLEITDADASVPAGLVQGQVPIPIDGLFLVHFDELELKGNVLRALKGNLTWNDAKVNNGNNWLSIGSYAAELSDNGSNGVKAKVFQLGGPMDVNLQVELLAPSGGKIQGELAMPKGFVESSNAAGLLAMFSQEGTTDESGKTHYTVDTAF